MDAIYLGLVVLLGALLVALVSGCAYLMQRAHHKNAMIGGVQSARDANSAKAAP